MRKSVTVLLICTITLVGLLSGGCETMAQSGGLGAALGAGAGAIIGNQSHNALAGALIGGAIGGLAGIIVHDIKAKRTKTAEQTAVENKYTPDQGVRVLGQQADVSPVQIRPGMAVKSSIQYAVLGGGTSGISIKETRTLKQNGQVLKQVSSEDVMRTDGTWESIQEISFPSSTPPGTYEISQAITMNNATQFDRTTSVTVAN